MFCLFSFFQDAYGFSNKQLAMYFNSVSEGMKVFGLDNHEVHLQCTIQVEKKMKKKLVIPI